MTIKGVYWFTGNTGAGKTTYAKHFGEWVRKNYAKRPIYLDGDEMRESISKDLGLTPSDRWQHNIRVARLAKQLADQGHIVIVSVICPYHALQTQVKKITQCKVALVDGGAWSTAETPYEPWKDADILLDAAVGARAHKFSDLWLHLLHAENKEGEGNESD